MHLWDRYLKAVWDDRRFWATWEPSDDIALGGVGTIGPDNIFSQTDTLESFGIPIEPFADTTLSGQDYTTQSGVSVIAKASGQLDQRFKKLTEADAGFSASFAAEGAVAMKMADASLARLANQTNLRRQVISSILRGKFPRDHAIIAAVRSAETGIVVVSQSSKGSVEVKAKAKTVAGNARVEFEVVDSSGSLAKFEENHGWTPEFLPIWVRPSVFDEIRDRLIHFLGGHATVRLMEDPDAAITVARPTRDVDDVFSDLFETRPPQLP